MMPSPHTLIVTPVAPTVIELPRQTLRLRLKPEVPTRGFVDGAWWPRSRDLAAELPALLAVLAIRLGRIERVVYNLATWQPAARRLTIEDYVVRLEGFRSQHADTVTAVGQGRQRLTLLVVPPETSQASAHHTMRTAALRDNADSAETLLAPSRVTLVSPPENSGTEHTQAATQRWEGDGGRIR